jgi:hypothetical protein
MIVVAARAAVEPKEVPMTDVLSWKPLRPVRGRPFAKGPPNPRVGRRAGGVREMFDTGRCGQFNLLA